MSKDSVVQPRSRNLTPRVSFPRAGAGLFVLPALVYVGLVFVWPVARLLLRSVSEPDEPLENFRRILGRALYTDALIRTFEYSALATVGTLLLGYPLAYRMRVARPAVRLVLVVLVVVPFFVALLVRTFGWMVILGRSGPITRLWEALTGNEIRLLYTPLAVQIGMVAILLPFMVLPLYSVMAGIDLRVVRAARVLGASPTAAFVTVFLPLTVSGIMAGVVLVFMLGIGFFITPELLGSNRGQVFATLMVNARTNFAGSPGFTEAMAVILLGVTLITLAISSRVVPLSRVWGGPLALPAQPLASVSAVDGQASAPRVAAGGSRRGQQLVVRAMAEHLLWPGVRLIGRLPGRVAAIPGWVLAVLALVVLDTPILVAIVISFGEDVFLSFPPDRLTLAWYGEFVETDYWIDALLTSLWIGFLTAIVTTILGVLTAIGLVRAEYPGKNAIISLLMSPLIIPQVITGIAIYYVFFPIGLVGTVHGIVLAHTLTALPIVTVIMAANLRTVDSRLEKAARVLGASAFRAFWHVTLPLLRSGIAVAAFFGFLGSFDELVFSLFLVGVEIRTLPIRLWEDLHFKLSPMLAVVSVVEIVVVVAVLLVAAALTRARQPGRGAA
ncbi:MAG: putative spermidine/putrescine transport system permease protein [Thermomicrobiales bacterium]|nr:putative spermidine/putrescine transport system permease protein [Thermomicrobiales bacterium]